MDLRENNLTDHQVKEVKNLILYNDLSYQPFIFTDDLETGVGQRVQDGFEKYGGKNKGGSIYWKDAPQETIQRLKDNLAEDPNHFRKCNAQYRRMYDHFIDSIVTQLEGDISGLSFAELGCNSGYFLHSLALRGAAKCIGLDVGPFEEVFKWFNKTLRINNYFHHAEWDPSTHSVNGFQIPEVDVFLSIAVSCHVPDPIQHLTYLCDYSKKAVFFWVPTNQGKGLEITYGQPQKVYKRFSWPFNFDNDVKLSVPFVKLILNNSGFEDIREIKCPDHWSETWKEIYSYHTCLVAFRTNDIRSALYKRDHNIPDPEKTKPYLKKANYKGFNIIFCDGQFYGLSQTEGRLDIKKVGQQDYKCVTGGSLAEVEHLIDHWKAES